MYGTGLNHKCAMALADAKRELSLAAKFKDVR